MRDDIRERYWQEIQDSINEGIMDRLEEDRLIEASLIADYADGPCDIGDLKIKDVIRLPACTYRARPLEADEDVWADVIPF